MDPCPRQMWTGEFEYRALLRASSPRAMLFCSLSRKKKLATGRGLRIMADKMGMGGCGFWAYLWETSCPWRRISDPRNVLIRSAGVAQANHGYHPAGGLQGSDPLISRASYPEGFSAHHTITPTSPQSPLGPFLHTGPAARGLAGCYSRVFILLASSPDVGGWDSAAVGNLAALILALV